MMMTLEELARCDDAASIATPDNIRALQKYIEQLRFTLLVAKNVLPNSNAIDPDGYAWNELTGDAQDRVKAVREQISVVLRWEDIDDDRPH